MTTPVSMPIEPEIEYPDTDGEPIAENTLQFRWIVTILGNVDALYQHDPKVFVAGDLLWYPVKGDPKIRIAPDTLVVFGRPKGNRGSYLQWQEGDIAPQVVWEVLSPGNRPAELDFKYDFYERYGVEEYYVYDPDHATTEGWIRRDGRFQPILEMNGWVSPRLRIRFDTAGEELLLYHPDGKRFLTFIELAQKADEAQRQAEREKHAREKLQLRAEEDRQTNERLLHQAEQERREKEKAKQRAEEAKQRADEAKQRAEQLAARLRALGIDPDA